MLRHVRMLTLSAALAALVSCATTNAAYQPATTPGGYGYSDADIDASRVRVTFHGNTLTSRGRVEALMLYHAAEVTLARGFDYFTVAERAGDAQSALQFYNGPNAERFYSRHWGYPSGTGWVSWRNPALKADVSYRQVTEFEASAEITLHQGTKPPDDPNAFDARAVQQRFRTIAAPSG